jgi:two-component system, OmpR family, sensor kinase
VRRLRSRLALRIYLAGLAQVGVLVVGFVLFIEVNRAYDRSRARDARAAVEEVAAKLEDSEALARELDRVQRTLDATIVIYDDEGRVLVTNRSEGDAPPGPPPGLGPLPPPHGPPRHEPGLFPLPHGPPGHEPGLFPVPHGPPRHEPGLFPRPHGPPIPAFMMPVQLPDGRVGRAVFASKTPRPPPRNGVAIVAIALIVVGVASLLTARSLVRPLARLSRAARAFGAGQLDARVDLARSDEIGEVAAAFDEMADRVQSLLRAEKELLANVSHELRTPLARIRVALDIAAEGDAQTAREALGEITEDLGELERLISDVLTAARLDLGGDAATSGIPPLRHERVDVHELVGRAASRFRGAHPDRALLAEIAPDLPFMEGDPVLLRRAVDNLLENAHKYSSLPEDGVELRASEAAGEIRIEVRDHGIGIASEDLPRIFRPFFRVDRSRTRATGGLGLGLALARRIVDAHHGTIEVESRVDEGTRMLVRLPVAPVQNR